MNARPNQHLGVSMPTYLYQAVDVLKDRLGKSRSATVAYLLDTALIYQLGESTVDKLYEHQQQVIENAAANRISSYARVRDNLYHQAKLIASAPNMSSDIEGIYQALKAGESLAGFELIG